LAKIILTKIHILHILFCCYYILSIKIYLAKIKLNVTGKAARNVMAVLTYL